jgi:hypothetical protein
MHPTLDKLESNVRGKFLTAKDTAVVRRMTGGRIDFYHNYNAYEVHLFLLAR